jgi:thymidylate synthase (FAD)
LLHFLSLRADPHAQYEIRAYAKVMLDTLSAVGPDDLRGISRIPDECRSNIREGAVIRRLLAGEEVDQASSGLSAREWRELMATIGR